MSVKHAVLGLLLQRQSYPYELSLLFNERMGRAWDVNRGQIYQMVQRLEQEVLVERVKNTSDRRGGEYLYQGTEKGAKEFRRWFDQRTERVRPHRDDLIIKLALSEPPDAPSLLKAIDRQGLKCAECLDEYCELEDQLKSVPADVRWKDAWPPLVVKAAIYHLESDLKWLDDVRDTINRLVVKHSGHQQGEHNQKAAGRMSAS